MAIQVVIKFNWTNNCRVNDCARRAIATAVGIGVGCREEYDFVVLANDDKCNFWSEAQSVARGCGEVRGRKVVTQNARGKNAGKQDVPRTRSSSSSRIALNSPSETPSTRYR